MSSFGIVSTILVSTKQLFDPITEVTGKLQPYFGVAANNRSIDIEARGIHNPEKLLNRTKCVDDLIFQSEIIEVLWWHKVSFSS